MQLIIGLGNPGDQYNFTRHNLGFLTLDFYAKVHQLDWQPHPKFGALWLKADNRIFIKPQDFYNNSGVAVRAFAHFYKVPPADLLVICDDFTRPFGATRYRQTGTAGGNNGLKSIITELDTTEFPRLRLGTGNDTVRRRLGDTDFVLGKFTPEEKAALPEFLMRACQEIDRKRG